MTRVSRSSMRTLLAALLVLALAGCGNGDDPDPKGSPAEWRAAVEDRIGHEFRDDAAWADYRDLYEELCDENENAEDWSMFIAVTVDGGSAASGIQEDVAYACPGSVDDVEEAIKSVQDAGTSVQEVCDTDPLLRTESQGRLAEASGC